MCRLTGQIEETADESVSGNTINLPVSEAAKLMGVGKQFIRKGLQDGKFPFGYAIKITGNRFTYYISPKKFTEYTGIEV